MLGRRLLLLAAVLLATGAIAAALTPRELRRGDTTLPHTMPTAPSQASGGTLGGARQVVRTVDASARRPPVVRARVGDLLRLQVLAPSPDSVQIAGLGRSQAVDQFSPARFDFLPDRTGTFPIRLQESGREIGRLVIAGAPL